MDRLVKPQMWWPGCNILHPLCPDWAWMLWEGAGQTVGCVGKQAGNPSQFKGTLTDMDPATDWVGSPSGGAVELDGVVGYVSASRPDALVPGQPWSAFIRAKLDESPALLGLFILNTGSVGMGIAYWWNSGNGMIALQGDTDSENYTTELSENPDITKWHDWLFTWDGTSNRLKIYCDGRDLSADSGTSLNAEKDGDVFVIGHGYNDGYDSQMSVECKALWNRELTANEALRLYADPWAAFRPACRWWLAVSAPPAGVAPTGVLSGSLVGPFGGPI